MSPLGRRESPLLRLWSPGPPRGNSKGSGSSPPFPGCRGPGPRPASRQIRANPVPSPKSTLYLSKFAVLHIEDPVLHRSLHGLSVALTASATIKDLGYQQQRNVTAAAEATAWGRLPSLSNFPFLVCGMRGRGWATGGVRLSALPLAEGQWGRTRQAEHRKHRGDRPTQAQDAPPRPGCMSTCLGDTGTATS